MFRFTLIALALGGCTQAAAPDAAEMARLEVVCNSEEFRERLTSTTSSMVEHVNRGLRFTREAALVEAEEKQATFKGAGGKDWTRVHLAAYDNAAVFKGMEWKERLSAVERFGVKICLEGK